MTRALEAYERLNNIRQENPDAFDQEAKIILDEFFESIEDENKRIHLQQLQFRLEGELRHYKDPIARMNKMVEIFWEGVKEFQQTIGKLK